MTGAGDGNRTHVRSLGSLQFNSKNAGLAAFLRFSERLNWKIMENGKRPACGERKRPGQRWSRGSRGWTRTNGCEPPTSRSRTEVSESIAGVALTSTGTAKILPKFVPTLGPQTVARPKEKCKCSV